MSKVTLDVASLQTAVTDSDYAVDTNTEVQMNLNEGTGLVTTNAVNDTSGDLQTSTSPPT